MTNPDDRPHAAFPWVASILGIVVGLLVVEGGLRLSGMTFLPKLSAIEFGWPDPTVIHDVYLEDPTLFWVPKGYPAALRDVRRDRPLIVYMGDSCTEFGGYASDVGARITHRFPGKPIEHFVAGVGGWSVSQGLRQFRRDILPLKPRVVTVYFGWNDHWTGFGVTDDEAAEIADAAASPTGGLRLTQLLLLARLQLRHAIASDRPNRVSERAFHDHLVEIVRLGKEHGVVTMLLTAPTSHERGAEPAYLRDRWLRNLDDLVPLHQAYVAVIRRVAAEHRVPLCDLAAEFAAMPRAELARYFQKDGIHFGDEGNHKVGERLFACLERERLTSTLGLE